jgi:hypothetical protein
MQYWLNNWIPIIEFPDTRNKQNDSEDVWSPIREWGSSYAHHGKNCKKLGKAYTKLGKGC